MALRPLKLSVVTFALLSVCALLSLPCDAGQAATATPAQDSSPNKANDGGPRGTKLVLKDGTFQIVREYQKNGDRVRYYSLERGTWEELPTSLVDWDATEKAQASRQKDADDLVAKIHKQEEAKRMDNVTDIDASLQVGNGAFLPSGEGMFVVEGKSVRIIDQAGTAMRADKKRVLEQVMAPIPIVPGKHNVVLQGAHAPLRLKSITPEFYLREAPPDPEHNSAIEHSRRQSDSGPDVVLIKAKVTRNGRQLEAVSTLFGETIGEKMNEISVQRWEVAANVYRFTLSQPLPPGEYALAEVLEDGLNLFVWDFGVDAGAATSSKN
jgi:hypothetical protein